MQKKKLAILGGGISGLSLGYYLHKFHPEYDLSLIEKGHSVGGWMQTFHKDDFLFEKAPRTFRTKSAHALLELVDELNMKDTLIGSNPQANRRYILAEGKLREVALNPFCYIMRKCLGEFLTEWKQPVKIVEDESIWEFSMRRFGREVTELLFDPLITGIYAGDIKKVSVRSAFTNLKMWEETYGSITKGLLKSFFEKKPERKVYFHPSLFSFKQGTSQLINALAQAAPLRIILDNKVEDLQFTNEGVTVVTPFESIQVEHVFSTLPPQELGRLLRPYHEEISHLLLSIPMASLIVVNLGFKKTVLRHHGFGYLVPSRENEEVLGVVFDSEIFPDHNSDDEETRLTVMLKYSEDSNEKVLTKCLEALKRHLDITASPDTYEITRALHCIPQLEVGHEQKMKTLKELLAKNFPRLSLAGNSERGVSVNTCIDLSKHMAQNFHGDNGK